MLKKLYADVHEDSVNCDVGMPCPCGEGVVSAMNWAKWTMKHREDGREHKMPDHFFRLQSYQKPDRA